METSSPHEEEVCCCHFLWPGQPEAISRVGGRIRFHIIVCLAKNSFLARVCAHKSPTSPPRTRGACQLDCSAQDMGKTLALFGRIKGWDCLRARRKCGQNKDGK